MDVWPAKIICKNIHIIINHISLFELVGIHCKQEPSVGSC